MFRNDFTDIVLLFDMTEENKQTGKILGIDYGSKRIGLAVSDENRQFAMPLSVIANDEDLMVKLEKIATDNEIKEIVMGESKDYSGKANLILMDSIELKEKLESKGYTVYFEPEFMTSVQAERFQGKTALTDASAAALILQSYLDKNYKTVNL